MARITEPHPWYTLEGGAESPWGRAVLPMEMTSVLAFKTPASWPVRQPSIGLFIDVEVQVLDGPIFVGQEYTLDREIIALGQSRRTESFWTESSLTDRDTGKVAARLLFHTGIFKASHP